jgi:hypothetical protein
VDLRLRADPEDGETIDESGNFHPGALKLFCNYDEHGQRLTRPNTLLIDSTQIEAGDTLEGEFRAAAGPEIQAFKEQYARERGGASFCIPRSAPSSSDASREPPSKPARPETGKTVLALHRAVALARRNPQARLLLATSRSLLARNRRRRQRCALRAAKQCAFAPPHSQLAVSTACCAHAERDFRLHETLEGMTLAPRHGNPRNVGWE